MSVRKKVLVIVSIVILTIALFLSFSYNLFAYKTSYATLMFKYDEEKYFTMHSLSTEALDSDFLKEETKYSTKISGTNIEGCSVFESEYYVDKEDKLNIKTVCTIKGEQKSTTTYYFKDSTLYVVKGEFKTKKAISLEDYIASYPNVFKFSKQYLFDTNLTADEKNKTSMDFSFSPFYTFGIKYSYSIGDVKLTYRYDLKGRIRKIKIKQVDETKECKISYKEKKFTFPNTEEFIEY